ncbi:MAG: GGDEF domain-containing protein [Huintestinicola sp.]
MNKKKNTFIGICLCKIQESFQTDFVKAVAKRAYEYGFKVIIYNSFADLYYKDGYTLGEAKIFDVIDFDMLSGLILLPETMKDKDMVEKLVSKAHEKNVFVVTADYRIDGCYNIMFNYRSAFEAIVRHVIEKHGCRTINMVAGIKGNDFSEERVSCFKKVLLEYGIEPEEDRILYGDFWADPTEKAFDEFMAKGLPLGDAFLCANDSMAMTICSKLAKCGYSVPEDVIVTGFDGIFAEQFHIPRLTTAKQDTELAGEKAVDAVAAHISGRDVGSLCLVDHKVAWTQSCGCKPIDYREATGNITPLFEMVTDEEYFDEYMSSFCTQTSKANGLDELAECVNRHLNPFHWYYICIVLENDFMNLYDTCEMFEPKENSGNARRLIFLQNDDEKYTKSYYSDKEPDRLQRAYDKYNVFVSWAIHFQEKNIGFVTSALSTGCDGLKSNADFKHLAKFSRNLNHVLEIANAQAMQKKVIARLQDLYIRDYVTGLYNRRGFYTEINRFVTETQLNKDGNKYLIVISVDMDGLKQINDTYGHAEGDIAIKTIANALLSCWGENEICSRFGGDEFMVASICSGDPERKSEELVSKMRSYLDAANATTEKPYVVNCSFGAFSKKIADDFSVDDLIKSADDLMYKEKAKHKQGKYRSKPRK